MENQANVEQEAQRLFTKLSKVGWTLEDCKLIAPMTLEINTLKKEQNAIILGHSYQTPDIMYGISDYLGDSYKLSKVAAETSAEKIIFCSVKFMGETAKLLNPKKQVLVPKIAGCSLADAITPEDVKELRRIYPHAGIVSYVNTSAAVKAESDACCTSANADKIVQAMPQEDVVFIPDELMGKNLRGMTTKNVILWKGKCIVHEEFTPEKVLSVRENYPGVKILAHTECSPSIIQHVDFAGSTSQMIKYVESNQEQNTYMLVTECGLTDRIKTEYPGKKVVGTCSLCPYMKEIMLKDVLKALKNPTPDQFIEIPEEIAVRARKSLEKMYELEKEISEKK